MFSSNAIHRVLSYSATILCDVRFEEQKTMSILVDWKCRTWKWRTKNDAWARAWNGMLNLYSVYSASNVRRLRALLCPAISFLHFHVLQFHALQIGPSISRPSFSCPAFSAPPSIRIVWKYIYSVVYEAIIYRLLCFTTAEIWLLYKLQPLVIPLYNQYITVWWTALHQISIPQFNNLSLTFYCLSGGLDPPLSLADKN